MIDIKVTGLAELKQRLAQLPPTIQRKVMRGAVSTAAAVFRKEAELRAPEYTGTVQDGHPPPGTLKKAIYQVRLREESVGTREVWKVSAKKGKKGKDGIDAYYASWVEYGTVNMAARPFMRPAFEVKKAESIEALRLYMAAKLPEAVESVK